MLARPSRFHERVGNAVTFKTCYCTPSDSNPLGNGEGVLLGRTYVLVGGTHPSNRWVLRSIAISSPKPPSESCMAPAPAVAADGQDQALAAAGELVVSVAAEELKARAALMFKLDAKEPASSGRPAITPRVTKELVQFAWWAINALCDEHGPALSLAFGNFDRVVALGWLLG